MQKTSKLKGMLLEEIWALKNKKIQEKGVMTLTLLSKKNKDQGNNPLDMGKIR